MNDGNQQNNQNSYQSTDISSSIASAIGNAEQVIDILIEKSRKKAREEAEQALLEYKTRIDLISKDLIKNISEGSIHISESINQAIKRKVEKEASSLSDNFIADSIRSAEQASANKPRSKDISKIDYELAKAAAELKDKTSKLNRTAGKELANESKNNGKNQPEDSKEAKNKNDQATPPDNGDEKVEDIIRFFS